MIVLGLTQTVIICGHDISNSREGAARKQSPTITRFPQGESRVMGTISRQGDPVCRKEKKLKSSMFKFLIQRKVS